ncbi:MAG TPA: LysE family translocator [Afifellaceae bacterium]|nr:LysE family translocator [Afifellaceae bacterium]
MNVELYIAYLATVAVFFATPPGPSQVLMISNSLRHGWRRSVATIMGDLSANSLQMAAAAFGLAVLISQSAAIIHVIKWAGVLYLLYIGYRTFTAPAPDLSRSAGPAVSRRRLYLQGFVTSATNPKAVLFFAALFPQFIDITLPIWPQLIVLGATYLTVDGILLVVWGGGAERVLSGLRRKGGLLNRVSGGMMFGAAGLLALKNVEAR